MKQHALFNDKQTGKIYSIIPAYSRLLNAGSNEEGKNAVLVSMLRQAQHKYVPQSGTTQPPGDRFLSEYDNYLFCSCYFHCECVS